MTDNLGKVRFTYLDYLFKEMYAVKSKHYPDSTFFKNDDKVILELEKSGTLWVLYSVWSNISDMFSFDYNETQQLIKEWMEAQLKQGVVAPIINYKYQSHQMEAQLKQGEVTPLLPKVRGIEWMEEQIKSREVTPKIRRNELGQSMEAQLKSREIEPDCNFNTNIIRVQEELEQEEVTPRNAIAPPFRWRKLDSEEVKPEKTTCFIDSVRWIKMNN